MPNIIYVNLDNSYNTTSGNGTSGYPYSKDQLEDYFDITSSATNKIYNTNEVTIVKLKGQWVEPTGHTYFINNLSASPGGNTITFDAWDLSAHGPWKIMASTSAMNTFIQLYNSATTGYSTPLIFKNGVIGYPCIRVNDEGGGSHAPLISANVSFKNCLIYYGLTFIKNNSNDGFYGCTFANSKNNGISLINYNEYMFPSVDNILFENCVFYDTVFNTNMYENVKISGCIFSGTSALTVSAISASATFYDTVFNWIPLATIPDFLAISLNNKNNLLYNSFGLIPTLSGRKTIGINDYRKGLFGEPRKGKGAFYFGDGDIYFALDSLAYGDGTALFPFCGNELIDNILIDPSCQFENEVYSMSGLKIVDSSYNCNFGSLYGKVTYKNIPNTAWKLVFCGSTSIGTSVVTGENLKLLRGILYLQKYNSRITFQNLERMNIESMFINFGNGSYPRFVYCGPDSSKFRGNIIISTTSGVEIDQILPGYNNFYFTDSILDINYFNNRYNTTASIYYTNIILSGCVLTAPNISALDASYGTVNYRLSSAVGSSILSNSSCQFNWTPPIWPDEYTLSKNAYSYMALTSANPITISGTGNWH